MAAAPKRHPILQVDDLTLQFGGVVALDGLSFTVDEGQICGLIGPNGAGKTSLFNVISRLYSARSGRVHLDGAELLDVPAHRITRAGVARTFQNVALFPGLTVRENVMVGAHVRGRAGFVSSALCLPAQRREERHLRARAAGILENLGLTHLRSRPAHGLPYGTLKRIELARALAAEPRLLMLDEPASGLTHAEVDELGEVIRRVRDDFGVTILLVEHHMALVMGISDKVVVMEFGRKIAEGPPEQVRTDPRVVDAYLGSSAA